MLDLGFVKLLFAEFTFAIDSVSIKLVLNGVGAQVVEGSLSLGDQ